MSSGEKQAVGPPDLGQLFARFLRQKAAKAASVTTIPEPVNEVLPFQAVVLHPVDLATALQESLLVTAYLLPEAEATALQEQAVEPPPEWSSLIRGQISILAVPLCIGNFPQLVRDVAPLLTRVPLSQLRPQAGQPVPVTGLAEWGQKMVSQLRWAEALLAVGVLRLARQGDLATALLQEIRRVVPAGWEGLLANEEAALAWHRGDSGEAVQLWNGHPQADNPVLRFNRGMAALFTGKPGVAAPLLAQAADILPETTAWHHLARLYLTVTESS